MSVFFKDLTQTRELAHIKPNVLGRYVSSPLTLFRFVRTKGWSCVVCQLHMPLEDYGWRHTIRHHAPLVSQQEMSFFRTGVYRKPEFHGNLHQAPLCLDCISTFRRTCGMIKRSDHYAAIQFLRSYMLRLHYEGKVQCKTVKK